MALPVSKFLVSTRNWGGFAINVGLGRELVLVNCDIKVLVPNWYWWFVIGCDFLSTGLGQYWGNWSSGCICINSKSYNNQSEEVKCLWCDWTAWMSHKSHWTVWTLQASSIATSPPAFYSPDRLRWERWVARQGQPATTHYYLLQFTVLQIKRKILLNIFLSNNLSK